MSRSSGRPAFLYSLITPLRCSSENDVASPVVPSTLRPLQPVSSRNRASLTERAASGAPASSTAVATAAMTPESFLFAIKLSADVVGRERGHVDQIGVLRGQVDDLNRIVEADEQRTDYRGAAQLLQHLGRDRRRMERGHHEHVGGAGEAAEWISRHQVRIERDVGRHLAVVLEIDALLIENAHRLLYLRGALAGWMSEG